MYVCIYKRKKNKCILLVTIAMINLSPGCKKLI